MALIQKRVAFFDVDNTLLKGSTLFFLGRGMYQRGFFTKKDISAFVLANLRYRLTGKENKDEIVRFQNAACEFIKGHNVVEIEKIGQEIYEEYVSPAIWQGTVEIAQEHLAKGEEVWLVTATPLDMANLMAKRLGFTGALGTKAETKDGIYTGKMIGNLLHGREKAVAIKELSARKATRKIPKIRRPKSVRTASVPSNPNSSPMTEKMKSVCASGRLPHFCLLLPRPVPSGPPEARPIML